MFNIKSSVPSNKEVKLIKYLYNPLTTPEKQGVKPTSRLPICTYVAMLAEYKCERRLRLN